MSSRWTALWLLLAGGLLAAEPQHVDHPIAEEVADQVDHLRAQAVGGSVKVDEVQRALRDLEQLRLRTQNRLGVLTRELQVAQQRLAEFPPDEAVPPAGAPPTPRQSALARLDTLKQFLRDNQRNADAIGNLSTELAEKDKQIRHRDELDEVEGRLGSETPNWSQLNQLVVKVTDVRGRIAARVSRIETELEETQQSLATLLPELAPADNAAAKGNGAANGAAPLTSPTPANEAAAPTGPEPGRDMEALLADQSPEVADAARRLETQRKQLRRWLGEYRLQLLRADDLRRRMEQQIQQQAAAELLQAGPSLPAAIRQAAGRPEQWVSFYGRIVEGSVVPTLSRRPALLVGLVLLLAVCGLVGRWVGRQLAASAERQQGEGFGSRLWQAILAVSARHAAAIFTLGGAAAAIATAGAPSDRTPFLALLCYALLLFVLMRMVNRTLLSPFPPARSLTPLEPRLEYTIARRVTMLMLVGVLGFLLFRILGEYALPTYPFLLLRAFFVGMLAINLGWLLWLTGHLPGMDRFGLGLRVATVGLLAFSLGAEFGGYRNLSQSLLRGVVGTVLVTPALWILRKLLEELFDSLRAGRGTLVRRLRSWLNAEDDAPLRGVAWLRFALGMLYWLTCALLLLRVWASNSGFRSTIALLDRSYKLGSVQMAPSRLVGALLALALVQVAAAWGTELLRGSLAHNRRLDPGAKDALVTLVGYAGVGVAWLVALTLLNINFAALAVVAGALSVGMGFGLQTVVSNFVSGLVLLFERPVRVGDSIEVAGHLGTVTRVSVRSTELTTANRTEVIVPNSELIAHPIVNRTRYAADGRVTVPVSVAYGSDLELVFRLLQAAAEAHQAVVPVPNLSPLVVLIAFGDSSLDLELRCVVTNVLTADVIRSDLLVAISGALAEHAIEIPFPRRDVALLEGGHTESP